MASSDRRLILLAPGDNCLAVAAALAAGSAVEIDGARVVLADAVEIGHKLARRDIGAGEKVVKYGAVIGSATRPIRRGEHIHLHNLASDYIPTYTLPRAP
ncbi:MAG: UxaA family hydrolase [Burkholderiales bacterium]|nr:UxaA family hydrolase [Burkholderiales bacterium]